MIPVQQLRMKYAAINEPDELLLQEHEKRLGGLIDRSLRNHQPSCEYHVRYITGAYGPMFAEQVTLALIERCRELGYTAAISGQGDEYKIRVSGWDKAEKEEEKEEKSDDVASMARRGVVSSRLAKRYLSLTRKNDGKRRSPE